MLRLCVIFAQCAFLSAVGFGGSERAVQRQKECETKCKAFDLGI
jgi:hypothetical protein